MFSLVICVVMVATMFSFAPGVFAAESGEEPAEYQISVIPSAGGTVSVDPETVTEETAAKGVKVIVTPDKGYGVSSIKINGAGHYGKRTGFLRQFFCLDHLSARRYEYSGRFSQKQRLCLRYAGCRPLWKRKPQPGFKILL